MKDEKRQKLLDKMVIYFLEGKNFSMGALSQDLNIARKTLYNHFHSRNELIGEMVEHFFRTRSETIEKIVDMDLPFLERGQKLMSHLAEVIGSTEIFCSRKEILDSDMDELYRRSHDRIKAKITRYIREGQEEGWILNDAPPQIISGLFFSLILGSVHNRDGEDVYASYIRIIIRGLATDKTLGAYRI